jgi:hypothetical protein
MNDYIRVNLNSKLTQVQMLQALREILPTFIWRGGDSDTQELYISGKDHQAINIQIWMGEHPFSMSVSFRCAWVATPDREGRMMTFSEYFLHHVCPKLGMLAASSPPL